MKNRKEFVLLVILAFISFNMMAQPNVHNQSTEYEWPKDSLVKIKLDEWQNSKFGMIIHWGLYSVPGMIESWSLCSENWIERDSTITYDNYKKWYWSLSNNFNPVKFNPEQWAQAAYNAGMRYLVFTTKHHDGFAMFNTKQTDFSIAQGPFKDNPKSDVAKYVFDAFRKKGFMIGAYFSKPDWHSEYYWWPKYATPDRNNNYDINKNPWRWNKFKQYTYNQISELMHNYGSIDILWLDGGWVRPLESVNEEVRSWGANIPNWSQNIDMKHIAEMARAAQPGLIMVDRTVHGPYENYQTPEQKIPLVKLEHPWESCMTLGDAWGFVPNDNYKSSYKVIHSLIEIVSKGGSLLLGVGPSAEGLIPDKAVKCLNKIGVWMNKNGEAIYNTRTTEIYHNDNVWFTQNKDGNKLFALVCLQEGDKIPEYLEWSGNLPAKGSKLILLETNKAVKWELINGKIRVILPRGLSKETEALAFSFRPVVKPAK
ncbi:alpha-L-fucosidase [Bacteroides sedimenti]|uniref:alpha-L-fucosidase n=1 Tax=Bacteroides sedimenti TaxID=2136147 RepID=A0ABM8IGI9_9BACE